MTTVNNSVDIERATYQELCRHFVNATKNRDSLKIAAAKAKAEGKHLEADGNYEEAKCKFLEAKQLKEKASRMSKLLTIDFRSMSDMCAKTMSGVTAQFSAMGIPFIDNVWGTSTGNSFKKWLDNKKKAILKCDDKSEEAAKQVLFVVAHSCKSGLKKNDSLYLYDDVYEKCIKHGIVLSHRDVKSITIKSLDDETINFIMSITSGKTSVCAKKPLVYEHYIPLDDVKQRLYKSISVKSATKNELYIETSDKVGGMMICWVSPYENSCIEHEFNRTDPWGDYSKANITIFDIDTHDPFTTEESLNKYIEDKNEAIKKCFQ